MLPAKTSWRPLGTRLDLVSRIVEVVAAALPYLFVCIVQIDVALLAIIVS